MSDGDQTIPENSESYNLDDGVVEYFEFIVKGHKYRFKYPTTEESAKFRGLKDSVKAGKKIMAEFISKVDEGSPSFEEISKTMTVPYWRKFNEMIATEMGKEE